MNATGHDQANDQPDTNLKAGFLDLNIFNFKFFRVMKKCGDARENGRGRELDVLTITNLP